MELLSIELVDIHIIDQGSERASFYVLSPDVTDVDEIQERLLGFCN